MDNQFRYAKKCRLVLRHGFRQVLLGIMAVVVLSLWACGEEQAVTKTSPVSKQVGDNDKGTIVAMGDSLTAGYGVDESEAYPALLEKKLRSDGIHYRVVNAGVSGETSSGALSRVQWVMSSLNPDIIILETGANDGLRGIDPQVLKENLDKIVSTILSNDTGVILAGMQMLPNLGPAYTAAFARVYTEIADKHAVTLIPFFLQGVAGDARYNQSDGIHPTPQGYSRIVGHIYPYVREALGEPLS